MRRITWRHTLTLGQPILWLVIAALLVACSWPLALGEPLHVPGAALGGGCLLLAGCALRAAWRSGNSATLLARLAEHEEALLRRTQRHTSPLRTLSCRTANGFVQNLLGDESPVEAKFEASESHGVKGQTVLIVDEDPEVCQALAVRLWRMGLQPVRSSDALQALVGAYRLEPDLVILDVNLPSGSGLTICEMLNNPQRPKRTPLIVYTLDADEETKKRVAELGAFYVSKGPGSWRQLRDLVCQLLSSATPSSRNPSPLPRVRAAFQAVSQSLVDTVECKMPSLEQLVDPDRNEDDVSADLKPIRPPRPARSKPRREGTGGNPWTYSQPD